MEESRNDIVNWLKHHTLDDMKSLAQEMADGGQDVSDLVEVINELEGIATTEGVEVPVEA